MRIVKLICIVFCFIACNKPKKSCQFTVDDLIKKNGAKVFGTKRTSNQVTEFRDKGNDSLTGGYYTFYQNGNLKSYEFFSDLKTYIYKEEYDKFGNFLNSQGDPSVYKVAELDGDSLFIKLYLFGLNKEYNYVNVDANNTKQLNLSIINDTVYTNMKLVTFVYRHLQKEGDMRTYFDIEYEDKCSKTLRRFKDSVILHYKPIETGVKKK